MRSVVFLILGFVLLISFGCGSRQQTFGVEDEKKRWVAEGWTYHETLGRAAEDTIMVGNFSSESDREIKAFARTDGIQTNKVYTQTQSLYLVVSMLRSNGDAFALI